MKKALLKYIPATSWLPNYQKQYLQGDLIAGITVAVMLVPQGMAYAMLAGLPPIIGLYASIIPLLIYALFGTSRQLAVGPVAIVSLMTATGIGGVISGASIETYIAYAVLLALMVGIIQLAMGIAKVGFLVTFLSHPVISGFTSAAALIIGFSQLKHLLGLDIPRSHHIHEIIMNAAGQWDQSHMTTLLIGLASIVLLLLLKRWKPMFPGALVVVFLSTLAVWGFDLHEQGVRIVGDVPAGFPTPQLPMMSFDAINALLPTAIVISLISFMESISVAKAFARRNKYDVNPNQELVGLGLANIAGSFFKAYPVTGGFSRTAVNGQAGANTPLASLITAAVISVVLIFFTPLFYFLPKAVLAAIIMTAVFGLIDWKEAKHLLYVKRSDFVAMMVTFFATLSLGIEKGILLGVALSLLWIIIRSSRPHTAILGRVPGTQAYRNLEKYPDAEQEDGILVMRVDAQFYFGNATYLKELINRYIDESATPVNVVVIEAASINQIDSSADAELQGIITELKSKNIEFYFANVKYPVMEVMIKSGLKDLIGNDKFFLSLHDAVQQARKSQQFA